jgi:hypothetical protein
MSRPMSDKRNGMALALANIEKRADKQASVHRCNGCWMARAHYGLGIPSAVFATAAATTALADYRLVAGICAAVAAVLTSINTFLGNTQDRARYEWGLATKLDAVKEDAEIVRLIELHNKPVDHLEADVRNFEQRLNKLCTSAYEAPASPEAGKATEPEPAAFSNGNAALLDG